MREERKVRASVLAIISLFICASILSCTRGEWQPKKEYQDTSETVDLTCPGDVQCLGEGDGKLYVGTARVKITPEWPSDKPIYIAGGANNRVATGVNDDIYANALIIQQNDIKVAIVTMDLIGFYFSDIGKVRKAIKPEWEIDLLVVTTTHNHQGPDVLGFWGAATFDTGRDPEYVDLIVNKIVEVVGKANEKLEVANFKFGCDELKNLTNDLREPYVFDEKICALEFSNRDTGKTIATLIRWGNHPESLSLENTLISSDFPGFARGFIGKERGGVALYVSGCVGGMMTPLGVDVYDEDGNLLPDPSIERTKRIGELVAEKANELLDSASFVDQPNISLRAKSFFLPIQNLGLQLSLCAGVTERETYTDGEPMGCEGDTLLTEVGVIRIGPAVIVGIPGEDFPELAFGGIENMNGDFPNAQPEPILTDEFKKIIGDGFTPIFVGLYQDELGYIIPKREYDFSLYEEGFCISYDAARNIADSLIQMMEELPLP